MRINELENIQGFVKTIGILSNDEINLTTDTRNIKTENLFLAINGDNFDAYKFIQKAIDGGIKNIVCEYSQEREKEANTLNEKEKVNFIFVEDALKFLQDSARDWIRKWQDSFNGKVLGLTGSNGKTTTKEILFELAKEVFKDKCICTKGNLNNHIGVPLTIFDIKENHEFAIVEMGTNHPGEISFLAEIANPDYAYITNVGSAHLEFLISEEGVYKEKTSLFDYVEQNGEKFFINCSDKYLVNYPLGDKGENIKVTSEIENNNIRESYNKINLNNAYYVMSSIFSKVDLLETAKNLSLPQNNRSQWISYKNKKIFLDAYNANPSSMCASIKSFHEAILNSEKSLYVIGDMNELGDLTEEKHKEISMLLNELGILNAIFIGRYAHFYEKSFKGSCQVYSKTEDFASQWQEVLNSYDNIFLKASRTLQLESLVDKL